MAKSIPCRFEVYQDTSGEHRWRLVSPNGNVLADSGEGYTRRHGAIRSIGKFRIHVQFATLKEKEKSS